MYMNLFKNLPTCRSAIMLQALKLTNDDNITLQMLALKDLIKFVMSTDIRKQKPPLSSTTLEYHSRQVGTVKSGAEDPNRVRR